MRNYTRDEGRSLEIGNQVLISGHRKLLSPERWPIACAMQHGVLLWVKTRCYRVATLTTGAPEITDITLVNLTALPTGPGSYVAATLAPGERATDPLHCTRIDPKTVRQSCARHQCVQEPTYGWLMRFLLHGDVPNGFRHLQVDV
jgi:hypothetical protein